MPIQDLRQWIALLEERGQLLRIADEVSPELEITEITDRIIKGPPAGNKALLFKAVKGSEVPVFINGFGSTERMAWALGADSLEALNHRMARLINLRLPKGMGQSFTRGREMLSALFSAGVRPKKVSKGAVQEVVEKDHPSIDFLPVLKCWPKDGGRFITLPQVITRDPISGVRNVGMYRLQVIDGHTLLMHWQRHKGGAEHERIARQAAQLHIPAVVVLGGDPASIWCASAPLPPNLDEYLLAGYLRGSPVPFVPCVTQPLEVPAQAEIAIEGYVDLTDYRDEGPFGDHTGYYTPVDRFPAFHITAVTHRRAPIYPATVVGIPPMEDAWMGKATERLFLPMIQLFLPEILDINMPAEGLFHNLVIVSIQKRYPGHARKVMHGLWGLGLLMLAKAILVVDDWVNVQDLSQVAWQAFGNVDWQRDLVLTQGPVDQLDHAASQISFGGKIGVDATAKWAEEGYPRGWPEKVSMPPEVIQRVDELVKKLAQL